MYVTPQQMRELERLTFKAGISYAEMMGNAGKALAEFVIKNYHAVNKILLIAGNGNNGGDCYVAAYYLKAEGKTVQILTPLGEPKTEISKQARNRAEQAGINIISERDSFLEEAELVIDGIFGTGFRGELPEEIQTLLKPRANQIRIACDIPSGGNGATGCGNCQWSTRDRHTKGRAHCGHSQRRQYRHSLSCLASDPHGHYCRKR